MKKTIKFALALGTTLAGMLLSGTGAQAQTSCNTSVGPDVIVGDLQDIANYASQTIGGVTYDAVSFGTYSCNIGNVWVNWFASTNQHPVIGNNLYKYSTVNGATRIEQIGMSWLKHGFYALSNTLCCSGCQSTNGMHLGVHCSDPYTASRNGDQAGLGPRWQVNATTGVFTYPPANPTYGGSVARRCRVATSDLAPSSTSIKYFGEAQYVTQDDAAAGNSNNNCSYRGVGVTGSGTAWTFSLLGATQRELPAIKAWAAQDPNVVVQDIDIPAGGRVVLAENVTDLGSNMWHYEFALFNLNCDDSIGGFSIPVGTATVTNIEFHDVAYHDGDGPGDVDFDGTDWPSAVNSGVLTWNTTPFATNPSANALRWGTMYNFRFDADQPPQAVSMALTTFKTAALVGVTAEGPTGAVGGPKAAFCYPAMSGVMQCPCNNSPAFPGAGCDNSGSTGGATLNASGNASLVMDTVVFTTTGEMPSATSVLLQGDAMNPNGVPFGQGVRCVTGSLHRMYLKTASGGAITAPEAGDQSVSLQSASLGDNIAPGSHRYYQVFYRDPNVVGGCSAALGFNVTQAYDVTWNP